MDLSGQTWVLTGANGAVGACLRAGIAPKVAALRLLDMKPTPCHHEREESLTADVRDQQALEKAFAGADGIIHLAGLADETDFHDLVDVNIVGTYHVLEAARRAKVPRVIYASSNRVTGFYSTETSVDTSMPPRPDGFYGVSKVAGEALGQLYADKFGLQVAAIRIGSFEVVPRDQRQLSTWLSEADCVRAFLAAMTAKDLTFSTFYAVSRNARRWWELGNGAAIGFDPQDNAEDHAHSMKIEDTRLPEGKLQGGLYATPSYSLDRLRPPNSG